MKEPTIILVGNAYEPYLNRLTRMTQIKLDIEIELSRRRLAFIFANAIRELIRIKLLGYLGLSILGHA